MQMAIWTAHPIPMARRGIGLHAHMQQSVISGRWAYDKIVVCVIEAIFVNMMDDSARRERLSKHALNNPSMLARSGAVRCMNAIPFF